MSPGRVLVVQHEDDAPPAQLAAALAAAGLELELRRPVERGDEVPEAVGGLAAVAVLGGAMGATDDAAFPHLARCRALMRDAVEREVPVLAICLGAQLASVEWGGGITRRPAGYRIGARPAPPLAPELFFWHHDAFAVPPGAEALGPTADAFRLGSLLGLQSHPEVDAGVAAGWCDESTGAAQLAEAGVTREAAIAGAERCAPHGRELLDGWCRGVGRRGNR